MHDTVTMKASTVATRPFLLFCFVVLLLHPLHVSSFSFRSGAGPVRRSDKRDQPRLPVAMAKNPADKEKLQTPGTSTTVLSKSSQRGIVWKVALGSLFSVSLAAKGGLLGSDYPDATILQDLKAALLCGVLGFLYVKLVSWLVSKEVLQPKVSRKIIHIGSAPLFMLFWPLFSQSGRFFAACIPLITAVRLYLAATGERNESEFANAISRSGDVKEALGGPFLYVVILILSILLFWTDNCVGVVAMSTMAAGDGMADIIGRQLGKNNKWFFAPDKSIAGSAAFLVSGTAVTIGILIWLSTAGCLTLPMPIPELATQVALITSACALIELLPIGDDNWTVPLSAALLSSIFLV